MRFEAKGMRGALVAALLAGAPLAPVASAHTQSHQDHGKPGAAGAAAAAQVVETAFGRSGDPAKVTRTIRIDMRDTMRFAPDAIEVRKGETVRLEIVNAGGMLHELVIGTDAELDEHAELMKKFPGMEHDEPYMAHVEPGKAGQIVWQFTKAGEFRFACLIPGHYEAGMVGRITVRQ